MKNFEYIIAGLPVLAQNYSFDSDSLIEEIAEGLDAADKKVFNAFLETFSSDFVLDEEFYKKALKDKNRFIRAYFSFDLDLRNLKVKYLNNRLGRKQDKDLVLIEDREECEVESSVNAILDQKDILKRERGIDDLYWNFIDEQNLWDLFNLDLILGFVAKVKIIDRWNKLDSETGRELFRKLVEEIRSTYDNKKTNLI